VVAYDRQTGRRLWSALDDKAGYAAPMHVTLAGAPQLLVFTADRLVGLSLDGGRVLWSHAWPTPNDINAAQPLQINDRRVFISSSYGTGAAVVEIVRNGDAYAAVEVWRNIRMKNRFTSSVLHDGFIYGLDENILACVDADTGDLMWKAGRYGYGQVLLADGHLIVLTADGDLTLVRARPDRHEEIARSGALEGKTWNHPAMADGILLVRNLREMAAFDLRD
jgi:outer membrane protein assembly factor BamB